MNELEVENIRFKGYTKGSKLCFDIDLKPNAVIVCMYLKGLPLYNRFKLIDNTPMKNEALCIVDRQYVEFAINFILASNLRENTIKMQKTGIDKIIIGTSPNTNDEYTKLYFSNAKDSTTDILREWSSLINNFRAEFTFDTEGPYEHELFMLLEYF